MSARLGLTRWGNSALAIAVIAAIAVSPAAPAGAMVTGSPAGAGDPIVAGPVLSLPAGLAVDGAGDVFVADYGNNRVVEETPDGSGGYARTIVAEQLKPQGVAVDAAGDVFVADSGNNRVVEETPVAGGGFTQAVVGSGLVQPAGVAVDAAGDVFVADSANNRVVEETPAAGGGFTQTVVLPGLTDPQSLAFDSSGDLFVAEQSAGQVLKEASDGKGQYTPSVVASGLGSPQALTVDGSGNVFVAVQGGGGQVLEESPDGSGGYTQSTVGGSFPNPGGVAVDSSGNLYVSLTEIVAGNALGRVEKNGVPIDDSGLLAPLAMTADGSGDVYVAQGGTHSVSKLTPGSGLYAQSVVAGFGGDEPVGLAADATGDLYIAVNSGEVVEESPGTSGYTQSVVASGITNPVGVAVDGSGDVFVTDSGGQVLEETPGGGGAYTQSVVASGLTTPVALAVDGSGDVYVADAGTNQVLKETPGGGGYTQSVVASGFSGARAVAVDGAGDVFVADAGNGRVLQETPGGGGYTQSVVDDGPSGGLTNPLSLGMDASQHLFVLDGHARSVFLRDLSASSHAQAITFTTSPAYYATPDFSPAAAESQLPVTYSNASGQCTVAGNLVHLTGAGSCTVTATQAGGEGWAQATLTQTFPVRKGRLTIAARNATVLYGQQPKLHYTLTGFGNGDTSSALTGHGVCSLDAGVPSDPGSYPGAIICLPGTLSGANYAVAFKTPGTLTITPAPQQVTITSKPAAPAYGGSYQVTATGGASGNPVTFATGPTSGAGVCAVSGSTVSFTAAGTCVIDAQQAGGLDYRAATAQQFIVVALAKLTVTADPKSRPAGTRNPPLSATISGFVDGQTLATSGVAGAPHCTTTATKTSPPGTYPIRCTLGTLTAPAGTYRFAFVAGQLTVS